MSAIAHATFDELREHRERIGALVTQMEPYTHEWSRLVRMIWEVDSVIAQRFDEIERAERLERTYARWSKKFATSLRRLRRAVVTATRQRQTPEHYRDTEPPVKRIAEFEPVSLPVQVTEFRDGGTVHYLQDEIDRRAAATLQWSPWGRRQRRNRRYEGWTRGIH